MKAVNIGNRGELMVGDHLIERLYGEIAFRFAGSGSDER